MKNIQYTTSPGIPPQSMDEEFLCHKKSPEWWYSTGYMHDEDGKLFSYQFTLADIRIYGLRFNILMIVLTDFETGKHYYNQESIFFGKNVMITPDSVGVDGKAEMTFGAEKLGLNMSGENFSLTIGLDVVKPRVWHCDKGTLKMGIDNNWTYYWSYTNLALSGKLVLDGREYRVTGKGWFDKQGGPFTLYDHRTQWEWFSIRFFDNEEIMLFSFPHVPYQDGTYIEKSGSYRRLNDLGVTQFRRKTGVFGRASPTQTPPSSHQLRKSYDYQIEPLGWAEAKGLKFSSGWKVVMKGVKDEEYTLAPIIDGQFNFFFFELLAEIKDTTGKVVGYSFVELLPGVYNEKNTMGAAFARVK